MRKPVLLAAVAVMVVLAGCAGAGPGSTTAPTDAEPDATSTDTDRTDDDGDQMGTVAFYISDDPNDIDDFRHLNVTVTEVQFHYAGNDSSDEETTVTVTSEPTTTESAEPTTTEPAEPTTTETAEMTAEATPALTSTATPEMAAAAAQETDDDEDEAEEDEADEENEPEDEAGGDDEADEESETEDGDEDDGDGQARWITRDFNDTTVDLTELQGANATLLENLSMPAGEYTQVRLVVSDINATLTDGSDQRVKLPSERLKLITPFTLGSGDTVNFVFDITVQKAGNSGKYILQPVAGESGTEQEIDRAD